MHHFPTGAEYLSMGTEGSRTVSLETPVYEGPPADVVLMSLLVEHDSGDLDEYRRRIAQKTAEVAATRAVALGVPAEAVASNQGWINDVSLVRSAWWTHYPDG